MEIKSFEIYCTLILLVAIGLMLPSKNIGQVTPFLQQELRIEKQEYNYSEGGHHYFFQDDRGFLWGKGEGGKIMRFDGYGLQYFEIDKNDSTAIGGVAWTTDTKILQDKTSKVWIKGARGLQYLDRYDPVKNKFDHIYNRLEAKVEEPNGGIGDICEDRKGDIWIRSQPYLFHYDVVSDHIISYKSPSWGGKLVFEDHFGNIWTTVEEQEYSHYALYQLDTVSGEFINRQEIKLIEASPIGWTRKDYSVALDDGKTMLMLVGGNLYLFDTKQLTITHLPKSLLDNKLGSTLFKSDSLILVGTFGYNVYQFDPNKRTFHKIFEDPDLKGSEHPGSIGKISQSKDGIVWLNSYSGSHKLFPFQRYFKRMPVPRKAKFGQYEETMLELQGEAVFDLESGMKGVRKKDLEIFGFDRNIPNIPNQNNVARQFINGHNGEFWMAVTWQAKKKRMLFIRRFNATGATVKDYSFRFWRNGYKALPVPKFPARDLRFSVEKLRMAEMDRNGGLWLETPRIVLRFDTESEELSIVKHFRDSTSILGFKTMYIDRKNQVWFNGKENGTVAKLDQNTGEFELISLKGKNDRDNPGKIWSIYEDHEGNMWFGGYEGGLVRLDKDYKNHKLYDIDDGFYNGQIRKIFEDHRNNLWVGEYLGDLAIYYPPEDRFIRFNYNDGIDYTQYWNPRVYQDADNFIYLPGNTYDFFYFHPDSMHIDSTVSPVVLTDFYLANKLVQVADSTGVLQKVLDFSSEIVLNYQQNDFSIHYTLPEFINPGELVFAYMLEPYHQNWQQVNKAREANFTNLDPGEYTFKVKAKNHHGFWSEPRILKLTILPPWYQTWWAYCVWVALLISSIVGMYQFQLSRKLAAEESRRLKEMDVVKTRLYTNITHEFRTPLTIILGMADQMKSDPKNWFNEGLQLIRRNGKQLLHLVNQLLDLSKLESGHMALKLILGDVVKYLQYLTESFHSYAESKDIRLHFASEIKSLEMNYDEEKLQNAFTNLVSNAIKFTQAGGDVYIRLSLVKSSTEIDNDQLSLVINDNGPGISKENLPHIFDRFYQVDDTHTRRGEGTGIGLALTKELVQLMGGTIEVESELESGTQFTILLPISKSVKTGTNSTGFITCS